MFQHCAGSFGTNIFTPFGGTGVAMFLVLSGYGLNESRKAKGMDGFWKKKAMRVFLPWVLFCIVITSLEKPFSLETLANYVLCVKHYWYVKYLFFCYVVFWISNRFFFRYRWAIFVAFAVFSLFGMGALQAEQSLSFLTGIVLSECKDRIERMTRKGDAWACIFFLVMGIAFLAVKQLPWIREQLDTPIYFAVQIWIKLPLALGIMLLLWLIPHRYSMNRLFLFWGTVSYELYLTHIALLNAGVVGNSCVQALAMIVVASLLSYSFFAFNSELKKYKNNNNK